MTWQAAFWCTAALCRIVSQNSVGVCACVCEHASVSVRAYVCVCVHNVKRAGLETDETNRCQICRVGPFSSRRSAECSPISHLAVLIRGHGAGSLMYAARPKEF